jgi:predicted AAA+ superfamily ATPase
MPTAGPFPRLLEFALRERAAQFAVVALTGPRQSGKTTLARRTFPGHAYLSLEQPDVREFAERDGRAFLAALPREGAILDEVQRVPQLLSWLQGSIDADPRPGRLVLTGSHAFELMAPVTQSLAGRAALLNLLPLSLAELRAGGLDLGTDALLLRGGYPRIHAEGLDRAVVLADYYATYVERDLRQLLELRNLAEFGRFVRLAAGRVGQVLNLQSLAADVGISGHTAKAWLALLEAGFLVRRLEPWFRNLGKRLVKAPKLYFTDTGLAAWLIGIRGEAQLATHPLRGALFENLVVMEFFKHALNRGQRPALNFYRDSSGLECDLVVEQGLAPGELGLVEAKSAQTFHPEHLRAMGRVCGIVGPEHFARRMLVMDGRLNIVRDGVEIVGLHARPGDPGLMS